MAVETLIDPLYLDWPSNNASAVIGINVEPSKIDAEVIPTLFSNNTGIKTPNPIIAQAKKRAKSLPIFLPNQGQKITIGMPAKPTNNQTYISVASKPDVSLAMAEIKVPKITYPKPYKPYEIEIKEKLKLFL